MSSITSEKALRIALEDTETSYFIRTNFSYPEQNPEIVSQRWISRNGKDYKWNVVIIEKLKNFLMGKEKMLNIALVEIDSTSGKIIKRHYLKNILVSEYEAYLKDKRV